MGSVKCEFWCGLRDHGNELDCYDEEKDLEEGEIQYRKESKENKAEEATKKGGSGRDAKIVSKDHILQVGPTTLDTE
ncbi:hypothetical protein NDU88_003146 [Pleurodeles waltl]|uniref:Uncharacterized protein n=1 Tax=Pleurodeles waltl TaxID=8319 RepID=A0AAV7UB96_PLEWA|nr:hypothetical protein NDU88_003146 [Pleurodeles waltl]